VRAALISDTVLPVYSGHRAIRLSDPGGRFQTHGPAGSGGLSVIMRPHRLTGTSRRPPIGWPQRGSGVQPVRVKYFLMEYLDQHRPSDPDRRS
jgi:hypothetical protein